MWACCHQALKNRVDRFLCKKRKESSIGHVHCCQLFKAALIASTLGWGKNTQYTNALYLWNHSTMWEHPESVKEISNAIISITNLSCPAPTLRKKDRNPRFNLAVTPFPHNCCLSYRSRKLASQSSYLFSPCCNQDNFSLSFRLSQTHPHTAVGQVPKSESRGAHFSRVEHV